LTALSFNFKLVVECDSIVYWA